MIFVAEINIMPLRIVNDSQGERIKQSLGKMGFEGIHKIRTGKHYTLKLEAENENQAEEMVNEICKSLLANDAIEGFEYKIKKS